VISAAWAAPSAAAYAAKAALPEINVNEVKQLKAEMFVPMQDKKGLSTADAISTLQDATAPLKYNLRRSKGRLEEAITKVEEVKEHLSEIFAKDLHYLSKCHEIKSMTSCAELTFKAALMRTESRGFHFREDYPERDDKNWLKWIILQKDGNKMKISTLPLPKDKYKIKPPD
jgi:succinate dehydrogenase/fumarate reductase flavoprotein subunit